MNYWPPTEGRIEAFDTDISSSEVLQRYFDKSTLVKSMNHIAYAELERHAFPTDSDDRRVIFLAGDSGNARKLVGELIDAIGFSVVDVGDLRYGARFQPGTPLFNAHLTKAEALKLLRLM